MRIKLLWCILMANTVYTYAQNISVFDASSNEPLSFVEVVGYFHGSETPIIHFTNEEGSVQFQTVQQMDSFSFRLVGYESTVLSLKQLELKQGKIYLVAKTEVLSEVVVSSYQEEKIRLTSLPIKSLQIKHMEEYGSLTLTDALTQINGVRALSTGPGISKPVIRGLYGNRILILFSGLRLDNQQWQDEHGLGLSTVGISNVEVIKGPLSILYGTEAVGGVVNIVEEQAPDSGTSETDVQLNVNTNTGGGVIQTGTKGVKGRHFYRFRAAHTSHADYTDGLGRRVLNSRFNGTVFKTSYGFLGDHWESINHYHFSDNKYGFIFSGDNSYITKDERWSRNLIGPHHIVQLHMFSSINKVQLKDSRLCVNLGYQSNQRSEDEGGGALSLQMHLQTTQYALKWKKKLAKHLALVVANNTSWFENTNFGRRKIVPDARMFESGASIYLRNQFDHIVFEYGFGGGVKHISTFKTPTVNSAEKEIKPFEQWREFANGIFGISVNPNLKWNVKLNLSTGVRAPNLAELSSNGLHEGIYTYELGNPNMQNEQNLMTDLSVSHRSSCFEFGISGFYNAFKGYIYLQPTANEWYGFPVCHYVQFPAQIYGAEARMVYKPIKTLKVSLDYSGIIGELKGREYLPYMPAQKLRPEIRFEKKHSKQLQWYVLSGAEFWADQKLVNSQESTSPGFYLLHAGLGLSKRYNGNQLTLNLVGNNLFNRPYYNHLSRFKNFGLLNMGRSISLNFKILFKQQYKHN